MYSGAMVLEAIREFNRAVPFVPYEIHMASGDKFNVPHPDFVSISPKGSYVIVIDQHERPHTLNALLIERASPNAAGRKRGRRAA